MSAAKGVVVLSDRHNQLSSKYLYEIREIAMNSSTWNFECRFTLLGPAKAPSCFLEGLYSPLAYSS